MNISRYKKSNAKEIFPLPRTSFFYSQKYAAPLRSAAQGGDFGKLMVSRNSELQLLAKGECAKGTRGGGREKIRVLE